MNAATAPPPASSPAPAAAPVSTVTTTDKLFDRPAGGDKPARQSFTDKLASKATPIAEPPPNAWERHVADPADRPGAAAPAEQTPEGDYPPASATETPPADPNAAQPAADPNKPKVKPNNWKALNDALKTERATTTQLQQEITRLKSERMPEQERTVVEQRATKAEARVKELEEHIRYVDYSKSSEFQEKYDGPYAKAWQRATSELSEVPVTDLTTNTVRAATAEDLMQLVNLPLGQARALAEEMFGNFADDAMGHRKEVRTLFEQREAALKEAKEKGGERQQQQLTQQREYLQKTAKEVGGLWQEINQQILANPQDSEFLKPIVVPEGKQPTPDEKEWNEFLTKGHGLVEKYWKMTPLDPKLTPEQRKEVIAGHAAIRLRAAAFGPLKRMTKRLQARITALEKQLGGFRQSTPPAGGGNGHQGAAPTLGARSSFSQVLAKKAAK